MKRTSLASFLAQRRDALLLLAALALLLAALLQPTVPLKRDIRNYFLVADISQSMNVTDMGSDAHPLTRMAHMQSMLRGIVSALPCGTKVSIGLFAGASIAAMYNPIEVCRNFAAIQYTIEQLDWRASWSGNSRIRSSVVSLASVLRAFPEPAQVVFFTDGEEAPLLHTFNRYNLSNFQGGDDWLLVGVGSEKGKPIPKLNEHNQLIGFWANESFAMQPGIAQISQSTMGTRDDNVANAAGDRYLSKMDEKYLISLAREINASYVRGDSIHHILDAMERQKPAKRDFAPYGIDWLLAAAAAVLLLWACLPPHPLTAAAAALRRGLRYRPSWLRRAASSNAASASGRAKKYP